MSELCREEVLRYLGYRGQKMDSEFEEKLARAMALCDRVARPRYVWGLFDDPKLQLPNTCGTAVFAATLGQEISHEIDVWQRRDMSFAALLDASATQAVEQICDAAEKEIAEWAHTMGLFPASRVSPGYGDLPLTLQEPILRLLDAGRRIGLYLARSLMLAPQKSVTALVSLHAAPQKRAAVRCNLCANVAQCEYRRLPK